MLAKCLLNRFELCISRMFMREVLMFSTERGSKDMAVDGTVVECADATVVHADLTEKHIIERTGLLLYFIYRNDDLQVVFLRYLIITYAASIVLGGRLTAVLNLYLSYRSDRRGGHPPRPALITQHTDLGAAYPWAGGGQWITYR